MWVLELLREFVIVGLLAFGFVVVAVVVDIARTVAVAGW